VPMIFGCINVFGTCRHHFPQSVMNAEVRPGIDSVAMTPSLYGGATAANATSNPSHIRLAGDR
jgi:hypothetical protein